MLWKVEVHFRSENRGVPYRVLVVADNAFLAVSKFMESLNIPESFTCNTITVSPIISGIHYLT